MPDEKDPFEVLRQKLEAKRKLQQGPAPEARPAAGPAGAPRPAAAAPAAKPGAAPAAKAAAPAAARPAPPAARKPEAPKAAPAPKPGAAPPAPAKGAEPARPKGFIRTAWTAEDFQRMEKNREEVAEEPPKGYVSHRADSGVARRLKGLPEEKEAPKPAPKPKGFESGRFDR
jgi:hypothetical protein